MNIIQVLKRVPFFAILSDAEIEGISHYFITKSFSKNDVVLHEADTANYMYIILGGKVKVVQTSQKGKERIFAIHRRGDFFGEMSLLDGKTEPATVIAMEKTDVALLAKKDFDHYLLRNQRVMDQIIRLLCNRLRDVWLMLKVMSFADAEQKVIAVLHQMSRLYGIKDQRGTVIHLRLTHKDIAGLAAISRETVTHIMNKLIKESVIEVLTNKSILIKPALIEKMDFL